MDNTNDHNLRAPRQDDLNDTLRTYIDDPNNEVKIYSDSLYISTEEVGNVLKKNYNRFSILSLNMQSLNSKYDSLSIFCLSCMIKTLNWKQYASKKHGYLLIMLHRSSIFRDIIWYIMGKIQPALWFGDQLIWWILVYH